MFGVSGWSNSYLVIPTFDVEAIEIDSKSEGFGEPHSPEPEDGYAAKSRIFGRVQGREQYFEELRACGTDL